MDYRSNPAWKLSRPMYRLLHKALGFEGAAQLLEVDLKTFVNMSSCNSVLDQNPEVFARYLERIKELEGTLELSLPTPSYSLIDELIKRESTPSHQLTLAEILHAAIHEGISIERSNKLKPRQPLIDRAAALAETHWRIIKSPTQLKVRLSTIHELEQVSANPAYYRPAEILNYSWIINYWLWEHLKRKLPAQLIQAHLETADTLRPQIPNSAPQKSLSIRIPENLMIYIRFMCRQSEAHSPGSRLTFSDLARMAIRNGIHAARENQALPPSVALGKDFKKMTIFVDPSTKEEIDEIAKATAEPEKTRRSHLILRWIKVFVDEHKDLFKSEKPPAFIDGTDTPNHAHPEP
jgi:hypothetical protein